MGLNADEAPLLGPAQDEGVDERFLEECVDEEISLGDFVLTGGEIPAMAVADAVCRMAPGVLPEAACYEEESHWNGLLEYPQYSRPEEWHGRRVPEVLLSGHHANVAAWRKKQSMHLLTALSVMSSLSASCCWVRPSASRRSRMNSPICFSSMLAPSLGYLGPL